jgi:hypothetical protein
MAAVPQLLFFVMFGHKLKKPHPGQYLIYPLPG